MYNKKRILLLFILAIIIIVSFSVHASDEILSLEKFPFYYNKLELKMNISGHINLSGNIDSINNLKAELYHYPKEEEKIELKYFNSYPDSKQENDTLTLIFKNNDIKKQLFYNVHSRMYVKKNQPSISQDMEFPLKNIPLEYQNYLSETEHIKLTNDIRDKASLLIQNSDTTLDAITKIGEWVYNNIEYVEDSQTIGVIQNSSWVFENKKGVCDEISTLFISMLRSVGIPTRFVSGMSYSDKDKEFGNHAWTEIYFPEIGWIPFDITYGEFNWLDSTHIPLSRSVDSKKNSLECSATGKSISITPAEVLFNAETIEKQDLDFPKIVLSLNLLSEEIGFGYNIIEAELTSYEKEIIIPEVILTKVEKLEILNSKNRFVVLEPEIPKKIIWIIKVNESIDTNLHYKFPIQINLRSNSSVIKYMYVSNKGILYSENYVQTFMKEKQEEDLNKYSRRIIINCEKIPIYILNRKTPMQCTIKSLTDNSEDKEIRNTEVCFKEECKTIGIKPNENNKILFNPAFTQIGLQTFKLTAKNSETTKTEYLNFNVKDQPEISLNIKSPDTITFNELLNININVSTKSVTRPKNLTIKLLGSGIGKKWDFTNFDIDQIINLKLKGKNLFAGKNNLKVEITWDNELGENFETEKTINIELINLNLWQKFYAFVNKLLN